MSKIEYCEFIKLFCKEGLIPVQIKEGLDGVYGESSLSISTVKELAKLFKFGSESLEINPLPGGSLEDVLSECTH